MRREEIHAAFHAAVAEELHRADVQHGEATDLYEMLAVLGEEYGELQKAALDFDYEGGSRDSILTECIQVGAMACKTFRFITERETSRRRSQCPSCSRSKDERGRHIPLAGTGEMPWCPDAFHV